MATKTAKKKAPAKKAAAKKKVVLAPVEDPRLKGAPTPVAPTINDARTDADPVLGHFVDVVSGPHKGRYGVFIEQSGTDDAVVRTRDDESERFTVALTDLRPALAGRR